MVEPVHITIEADKVGQDTINLPQFSGYEVLVSKRGVDFLDDAEYESLPGGGFKLLGGLTFSLGEKYTVIPKSFDVTASFSKSIYPVIQYPHRLVLTTVSESSLDENGNWQSGVTATKELACRAEPNSKNAYLVVADGKQLYFDYTVYMPLPVDSIAVGAQAEVFNGATILSKTDVKRFSLGQLNARLWL